MCLQRLHLTALPDRLRLQAALPLLRSSPRTGALLRLQEQPRLAPALLLLLLLLLALLLLLLLAFVKEKGVGGECVAR